MATATSIVNDALTALGVNNQLTPLDPYLEEQLFKALIRLINRWAAVDISLGITIPAVPADELGNPESTDDALITTLAMDGQKIVKVTASAALRRDQKIYYRQMKAAFGLWPQQSMPNSMPLGQGNNIGPRSERFFPDVSTVGSNSDTGLGT
jgi:hypothetical protein